MIRRYRGSIPLSSKNKMWGFEPLLKFMKNLLEKLQTKFKIFVKKSLVTLTNTTFIKNLLKIFSVNAFKDITPDLKDVITVSDIAYKNSTCLKTIVIDFFNSFNDESFDKAVLDITKLNLEYRLMISGTLMFKDLNNENVCISLAPRHCQKKDLEIRKLFSDIKQEILSKEKYYNFKLVHQVKLKIFY